MLNHISLAKGRVEVKQLVKKKKKNCVKKWSDTTNGQKHMALTT